MVSPELFNRLRALVDVLNVTTSNHTAEHRIGTHRGDLWAMQSPIRLPSATLQKMIAPDTRNSTQLSTPCPSDDKKRAAMLTDAISGTTQEIEIIRNTDTGDSLLLFDAAMINSHVVSCGEDWPGVSAPGQAVNSSNVLCSTLAAAILWAVSYPRRKYPRIIPILIYGKTYGT